MSHPEKSHAHESHEKTHAHPKTTTTVDTSGELAAIRSRIANYRRDLHNGMAGPFNTSHLADAEWLLVELDKALGHKEAMTPAELAELNDLIALRKLEPHQQLVMDRISGKHGELTPEELVERDYLTMQQDAKLGQQHERFAELTAKYKKFEEK